MASAGSIFVDLLLKDASYVQGLNRARGSTRQFSGSVQGDMSKTGRAFNSVLSPVNNIGTAIAGLSGVLAGALSTQKIVAYADAYAALESRLNLVTGSAEETARVQQRLFEISQDNAQPLNETISAYTRLSNSLGENQKAQYDLTRITELLSKTLVLSGTNAAGAATFFQQFGQAASSDFKAIGQEIQTFADQNPAFFKILNDEARKYGKTLKQLAADGELSFQFVADALLKSGAEIDNNSQQIALTVGRAFQQLDNAFLNFIGQTDVVNAGTSSLASAISFLAQNLDIAAKAIIVVSGAIGINFVRSMVLANASIVRYNISLAALEFGSKTAGAAMVGFSAVTRTLALSFAALGGPIGIGFIAVLTALALNTDEAAEAESRYNKILGDVAQSYVGYANASSDAKAQIDKDANDRIQSINKELESLEKLILGYAQIERRGDRIALNVQDIIAPVSFGLIESPSKVMEQYEAAQKALEEFQKIRNEAQNPSTPPNNPLIDPKAAKEAEKSAKELASIYERNRDVIIGLDKATINYQDTLEELNKLLVGGTITQDQYNEAIMRTQEEYDKATAKANVWAFDTEAAAKRASENIQDTFADFLFDPFSKGLDGMLLGFIDTLRRMMAEAASANILSGLFGEGGFGSGGGLLGGVIGKSGSDGSAGTGLAGFFDGFFAEGGYIQPGHFGVAGEAGAELLYGGKSGVSVMPQGKGGNTYNIDARGADQGAVRRLESALLALAGPGVIEQRVAGAQVRGSL